MTEVLKWKYQVKYHITLLQSESFLRINTTFIKWINLLSTFHERQSVRFFSWKPSRRVHVFFSNRLQWEFSTGKDYISTVKTGSACEYNRRTHENYSFKTNLRWQTTGSVCFREYIVGHLCCEGGFRLHKLLFSILRLRSGETKELKALRNLFFSFY